MIALALEALVSATLLMVLVLAVRKPVAEYFGADWAYALWLLPVVVPFLPDLPSLNPAPAFTVLLPPTATGGADVPAPTTSGEWLLLLLAFWGGGAAFFAIWQQSTYSAFMLHLGPQGRSAVPPSYGGIKVIESDAVEGPVALGIFNRRIVVPVDFATRYSATEQRLALEHELVHHRRFDIVWNWVALGVLTLNWFNPIAHLAFRAFRADQELACDAAVTRRAPDLRHDYACALVKSASQPGLIAACPLNHAEFLKRRLRMMKQHRASWARTAGGLGSVALLTVGSLAVGTPGFAQVEPKESGQVVVSRQAEPVISKTDLARLREKCGRDEDSGTYSVVCNEDEAKDPEVRQIMDRTMRRVDEHVEKSVRKALAEAKIDETVERAVADLDGLDIERPDKLAQLTALRQGPLVRLDSARHRRELRRSMERLHDQLARIPGHDVQARARATAFAKVDVDAITRDALRSAEAGIAAAHSGLSARERDELRRELDAVRREAEREAAQARREAEREAMNARREAEQEAQAARREAEREAESARQEALREAAEARRQAIRDALQAQRDVEQAQRDVEVARREAARATEEARRQVEAAERQVAAARRQALRAQEAARRHAENEMRNAELRHRSMTPPPAPPRTPTPPRPGR